MSTVDEPKSSAPWLYVQSTGKLYRPDGSHCADCYSGHGSGINNPAMQTVENVGPIPVGLYVIGEVDDHKGPLTIHLVPDPLNDMHGRHRFLLHGDNHFMNHTASEGCIVAPPAARAEVASVGGTLRVISKPIPEESGTRGIDES